MFTELRESLSKQREKFNCIIDAENGNKSSGNWHLMSQWEKRIFQFINRKLFCRLPWPIRISIHHRHCLSLLTLITFMSPRFTQQAGKSNKHRRKNHSITFVSTNIKSLFDEHPISSFIIDDVVESKLERDFSNVTC